MVPMSELPDFETAYRAVQGRDPRFDGRLFSGSRRPGSTAARPARRGRRSRRTSASTPPRRPRSRPGSGPASGAGPTPCRAAAPGTTAATWSARALRLIAAGTVDEGGVAGLAAPAARQRAPPPPQPGRRGRGRPAGAGPDPPGADRAAAHRPDRPADDRRRVRRRVRERPPVQRRDAARSSAARRPSCAAALRGTPDPDGRTPGRERRWCCGWCTVSRTPPRAWLRWQDAHAVPGLEEVADGHLSPGRADLARDPRWSS